MGKYHLEAHEVFHILPFKVCSIQKDPKVFSVISGSERVETGGRMNAVLL